LISKAAPSLDSIQKAFNNLARITDEMSDPKGDFKQTLANIKETFAKINAGEGTLGLLVSDPKLYKQVLEAVAKAQNFIDSLNNSKGALGMVLNDPEVKAELRRTFKDVEVIAANLRQGSAPLSESLAKLPAIIGKVEAFMKNLDQAGEGLPELVDTGQNVLSDADKVAEGAKKLPILRRYIPKPKERTIRMEQEVK
jgi:ABC-type transporter Mla subunit MlaD